MLLIGILLLPSGRADRTAQRLLIAATIALTVLPMMVSVVAPGPIVTTPDKPDGVVPWLVNPLGITGLGTVTDALQVTIAIAGLALTLAVFVYTAVRWRRSSGPARRMFAWATALQALGLPVAVLLGVAPAVAGPVAIAQTVALELLIGYAIVRWHAYDIELALRRPVLVAASLVAGLGTYALVVVAVSTLVGSDSNVPTTVGAAVAIFAFGPLSVWIRRSVNRLFYGRRDDPYSVVAELGRQTAAASDPDTALDAIVEALTTQLRLPYASISDTSGALLAERGEADEQGRLDVPLSHQGRAAGTLTVGLRRGSGVVAGPSSTCSTRSPSRSARLSPPMGSWTDFGRHENGW